MARGLLVKIVTLLSILLAVGKIWQSNIILK